MNIFVWKVNESEDFSLCFTENFNFYLCLHLHQFEWSFRNRMLGREKRGGGGEVQVVEQDCNSKVIYAFICRYFWHHGMHQMWTRFMLCYHTICIMHAMHIYIYIYIGFVGVCVLCVIQSAPEPIIFPFALFLLTYICIYNFFWLSRRRRSGKHYGNVIIIMREHYAIYRGTLTHTHTHTHSQDMRIMIIFRQRFFYAGINTSILYNIYNEPIMKSSILRAQSIGINLDLSSNVS